MKKRLLSPFLTHKSNNSITIYSKNNNNNNTTNKAIKNIIMKNKQTRNIANTKLDTKEEIPNTGNNNSNSTEQNTIKFSNKLKYKQLPNLDKKYNSPKCRYEEKINYTKIFKEKHSSYKNILDSITESKSFRTIGNMKSSFNAFSPKRNGAHKNRCETTMKSLYRKLLIGQKNEIEKIQTKIKAIKELKHQIRIQNNTGKLNFTDNSNTDNSDNDITRQQETEITFYNNSLNDTKKEYLPIRYFDILRDDLNSYYNNDYITSLKKLDNDILIKDLKNLINKGVKLQTDHQKNYEILIKDFRFYQRLYKTNNKNYRAIFKKYNKLHSKLLSNDYSEELNRYNLTNGINSRKKIIENNELRLWDSLISKNIYEMKNKNKITELFLYICDKYQNTLNRLSLRFYSNLKKRYNKKKINKNINSIENEGHDKIVKKNNKNNKNYTKPICVVYKNIKRSSSNTPKFRSIGLPSNKKNFKV